MGGQSRRADADTRGGGLTDLKCALLMEVVSLMVAG